jgi:hypothetical protein
MQHVNERVSASYLELPTPRPFPFDAVVDLLTDYLFWPALRKLIDPVVAPGILAIFTLSFFKASGWLIALIVLAIVVRLSTDVRKVGGRIRDEVALLRHGLTVRAHVMQLRPYRSTLGEIDGARLDCAIPVAARRTYIGSIWLSDGTEAVEVAKRGRLTVICLPRTPGTWRIVEQLSSEVRYDRMGPIERIPSDLI